MSRNNNSIYTVQLSIESEALNFLANINHGKMPMKCSRFQAFADLIAKFYSATLRGDEDGISVTDLQKAWRWSYPTVSAYVRKLESFGLVITSKIGNCNFVAPKSQIFVLADKDTPIDQLHVRDANSASERKI